jgi:flagellar assembly protein FliH
MRSSIVPPDPEKRSEPVVWRTIASKNASRLEQELEAKLREAREAGHSEAQASMETKMRPVLERLGDALKDLATLRGQIARQTERDLVDLSLEIAKKILHQELAANPASIQSMVRAALQKLDAQEIQRVRVHPDQEEFVREYLAPLGTKVEVVADPALESGGAIFDFNRGRLDASIGTQLKEIERSLHED